MFGFALAIRQKTPPVLPPVQIVRKTPHKLPWLSMIWMITGDWEYLVLNLEFAVWNTKGEALGWPGQPFPASDPWVSRSGYPASFITIWYITLLLFTRDL